MKHLKLTSFALLVFTLFSCSNDDKPAPVNEEEVITTIKVTLVNGGNTITLQSQDLDGDGPNAPKVTVSGDLAASTTYLGSVKFLNELENPAENITAEVEEEGVDHQIFYQLTNSLGTITYDDVDDNGNPIGLEFTLVTGNAGSGTLTVTLRHEPNKEASGVSNGDITNAGGSTDAEVSFPILIQ
ncbi:type 1 periplasmic binding fold superfamily protein [Flavobacterium sp.]|uniref:type 1 periplasmic binding fold superfamily protein n=1 Tax=Flavobacterium sp. TaxID=239 RepID=UPI003528A260